VFRCGFFWFTTQADAIDLVGKCDVCQKFTNQPHVFGKNLKTIPITWPFVVWGLDMVGPFKRARGGMTHLLVMVNKFSMWVEAKSIKKLDSD
jgi:hypothetical protein